ncbi:hypothetical protein VB738_12735 [Cyanobium gracile UHCC 0139]|uniref:PD(D/E)XK endonuclease domain-containing protein n=1 Tax=Cyanobium gracile UHCC 0139 TaxID=3110308 RepID=A0ABU5RWH3_9CYAN|nr:hypothetical protein [Cyanobium gracile]MEA5392125.1 hypothetical protein [Cyanobium gracile UHCC 0139]
MSSHTAYQDLPERSTNFAHNETGISGEYFVMHMLSRQGYICSMSTGAAKGIDIMVYDPETNKFCKVEVKTARDAYRSPKTEPFYDWPVSSKAEQRRESNLVYCFVHLGQSLKDTRCFLFRAEDVANLVTKEHADWAATGKDEATRKKRMDSTLRKFWFDEAKNATAHEDAWHLINEALT